MDTKELENPGDVPSISWAPWITPRRLMVFVIGWIVLFALISILISNPFQNEASASATPDYAHVMFLHGLLVSMVALMALVVCQILSLRSLTVRVWITVCAILATVLASIGGI